MLNCIGIGVRCVSSGAARSLGLSQQRGWPFEDETLAVKISALLGLFACLPDSACLSLAARSPVFPGRSHQRFGQGETVSPPLPSQCRRKRLRKTRRHHV
jgi:hypothetical protein